MRLAYTNLNLADRPLEPSAHRFSTTTFLFFLKTNRIPAAFSKTSYRAMRTTERLEVSGTGAGFVGQNSLQMVHVGNPHSLHALMMGGLFGQSGQSVTGAAPLGMVGLAQQNIAAILHAQHAAALQSAGTESLASQQLLLLSAYQSHEHDIRNGKDATDEDMEDGRRGDTWNDGEMSGSEEGIHENKEGGVGCWVNSNLQVSLDGGSSHKRNIVYTKAKLLLLAN